MMMRVTALLLALTLWLAAGVPTAFACSCEQPPANANLRGSTPFDRDKNWRFDRATNVAHGKIIGVRAGQDIRRDGEGFVLATMRVDVVMKGNVPAGDVPVLTGASGSSCGIGDRLLWAAASGTDLSVELVGSETRMFVKALPGEFYVSYCGYFRFGPDPNLSRQ